MGLYISDEDVKTRLIGKVRFTDDPENKNEMHFMLLKQLIAEAESQLEFDLSPRYEIPFQGTDGSAFKNLPDRLPTKNIIKTLCRLLSVVKVLETDFGRGSVVGGDKYAKSLEDRYKKIIAQLLERKGPANEQSGWMYPPLPALKLAYFNLHSDDGFQGMVINSSNMAESGAFPAAQINHPGQSWFNATFDDLSESQFSED